MKFKKFYHDNLFTWKFCLKLCTILFSIIYIGIGIAIGFKTGEFENFFFIFFSSILLGVMTSFIIAILGLTSAYYENKKLLSIYEQTPKIIIDNFNLNLYNTHKNEKYNFKRYVILGFSEKYIIELNHNENLKNIFITLKMNLTLIENYSKKSLYIKKKYKKERVILTTAGISKSIEMNNWVNYNIENMHSLITNLILISKNEKLTLLKKN